MLTAIIIFAVTIALMILSVLFFPKIKLGKLSVSTYWVVTLLGAAILLIFKIGDAGEVGRRLI